MKRQEVLLSLLIAIGGSIFGFMLGNRPDESGSVRNASANTEDLQVVLREIRNLAEQMTELASAMDQTPLEAPRKERTPVYAQTNKSCEELEAVMERCVALLEGMSQSAVRGPSPRIELTPTTGSKGNFSEYAREQNNDRFAEDHLLQSYQQILDQYGKPSAVYCADPWVLWEYHTIDPSGEERIYAVKFTDGFAYESYID